MRLARVALCASVLLPALSSAGHPSGGHRAVAGYGIAADVPARWHARMLRGALHVATVPLPPERRPIGPTLSHRLGLGDIGLLLFEAAPIEGVPFDPGVYRVGPTRPFASRDFRAHGSGSGRHSFARRNFSVDGRYFDLFVESGSSRPTSNRLAELNELVRSLEIEAGDFYPGQAAPARFRRAGGWVTTSSGTVAVGPSTYSIVLASTVRYRNRLNEFPPHRTLERLPSDGIIVWMSLNADNRHPPTVPGGDRSRPVLRVGGSACGSFEGAQGVLTCSFRAWRAHQYHVRGWVIFGRTRPTGAQVARAQEEFARLELPAWPRWPGPS